ncbi:MAG: diguanylate cyclase, partial [Frankiaceae bacterium]|nr:diguanylate cyclase [Frankiaceae bacterium]
LQTGQVVAYEALARWLVDGVLTLPSQWVPIAESTGDITAIGERVFALAAAQLARWRRDDRQIHMAVNVSPRQLVTPDLRLAVEAALSQGLPPNSICIEVTEGIVVVDEALRELVRLRELGVLIALDDFGTGYSSLAAISRLPVDIVKIDQSFTARLGQRDGDALATTVVTLADELGLVVIAEGIETASQARALADLGCPFGQGFLFGRAVPGADVDLGANGGWARELGSLSSGGVGDRRVLRSHSARHLA